MKVFFALKDNVLDKKLGQFLNNMEFTKRKRGHALMEKFVNFYADNFTNGNKNKA
jgi:hypothetical protein